MESRIYDLQPEADEFRRLYMDNISESINWGDMVEVFGAVDEDRKARVRLADELQETVDRAGAYLDSQIVYASKSGYSWLKEYVIPRLRGLKPYRVIIQAKTDDSPRITEKSNKSCNNILTDVPEELAGIGAVIANGLCLNPEDVIFERYEGKADWTYVCLSENVRGVRTNAGAFKVRFSERKAEVGAAAPRTTGYIQVFINNDKILDRPIKTEAEQAWELFKDEILPEFVALFKGSKDYNHNRNESENVKDGGDRTKYSDNEFNQDDKDYKDNKDDKDYKDYKDYKDDGGYRNKGDNKDNRGNDESISGETETGGNDESIRNGTGAAAVLRIELALGTPGVTLVDDELSKRSLNELCEAMLAYGDKYLEAQGFDFGGRTAAEAGVLSVAVVEYMGMPQVRVSVQPMMCADGEKGTNILHHNYTTI